MKINRATHWAVCLGVLCLLVYCTAADAAPASDNESIFSETELMFIGEELYTVSIASRKPEPLRRAPAAVTVIQGEQLKSYRTLAETLRGVPGFFIDRNEVKERIYLRGIPDSFLVMMDGVPFSNDSSTGDYPRGMELSLEYLEKIEIIRGPGSALWGPDAFSGIINLVTKKGELLQGVSVLAETGPYDTRRTALQAGWNARGWDAVLFGSISHSEDFEHDIPGRPQRKDDRFREFYGKVSYKDFFEISGRHSSARNNYTVPEFLLEGSDQKPFSFLQASLHKPFEQSSLSFQGWYQYFESTDKYGYYDNPVNYLVRQDQTNRQYGLELKYDRTLFSNNFATLGASLRYNDGSSTRLRTDTTRETLLSGYANSLYSFYFQDKISITDTLETTFGLRYDNHSEYSSAVSPRFGINYTFFEYLTLKLLYGRAFRTPSLIVLASTSGLDPEQIDSFEAQLGFHYATLFSIEINYFYNELEDLVEQDLLDSTYKNSGKEHIKGFEISLGYRPLSSLSFFANYSHLFGDRQKGASATLEIPNPDNPEASLESTLESFLNVAPDTMYNAGIEYRFWKHARLTFELNYVDKRKLAQSSTRVRGNGSQDSRFKINKRRTSLSSYLLFDVNFFITDYPFTNLEMVLKIKNITDKRYYTRGTLGIQDGEGSSMYFMLRYRY